MALPQEGSQGYGTIPPWSWFTAVGTEGSHADRHCPALALLQERSGTRLVGMEGSCINSSQVESPDRSKKGGSPDNVIMVWGVSASEEGGMRGIRAAESPGSLEYNRVQAVVWS